MSQQNSVQVIPASNALREKVGGRFNAIDPAAIAKAEAALQSLSSNFAQWLNDEVVKLDGARLRVKTEGQTAEAMEFLYLRCHDLKGLGTTYGFPLISRFSSSLCKLIDDKQKRVNAPINLIDAHIDAIKAAVRNEIKTDEHPVGRALIAELEKTVADLSA
ncbi:MAG: Hpt domain-containing protein [Phenylobacterium zucineum]|nr:MAG: Hpt domain-containing protein [Phenylobacterium zucineum]